MEQRTAIRFFLVGLPVGLLLLGAGSMVWTQFFGGTRPESGREARHRNLAAEMMRKPVDREDLEAYVRVLSEDIGERNLDRHDKLRSAAFWIESTIGPNNMGYAVERQKFEAEEKEVWNVVATLPGRMDREGTVVVGAHYDSEPGSPGANGNGSGVAGLLALANAFSGADNERTLQFVGFVNGAPPRAGSSADGCRFFFEDCRRRGVKVKAAILLNSIGFYDYQPGEQRHPASVEGKLPDRWKFVAAIGNNRNGERAGAAFSLFARHYLRPETRPPVSAFPVLFGKPKAGDENDWAVLSPFWDAEFSAVAVTDTAQFRNARHGTAADRMDAIDFEKMTAVVQGLAPIVGMLANPSR